MAEKVVSPTKKPATKKRATTKKVARKQMQITAVSAPPQNPIERLMEIVATKPSIDVDKLERVIAIYEKERADQRRAEFHRHFAILQSKLQPVMRSKNVDDKYTYAPLEDIVKVCGPIVNESGFSYRWAEEDLPPQVVELDDGKRQLKKMRRYWFILTGYGHEERNYVDLPEQIGQDTGRFSLNAAQKRGSLIAGLGIVFEGEDDDAVRAFTAEDALQYAGQLEQLRSSTTLVELRDNFRHIYEELAQAKDDRGKELIMLVKDQLKKELTEVERAGN